MLNYSGLIYRISRTLIHIFISFSSACPAGWYGQDCKQVALCGEGARSDPVTGRCVCNISHQGEDCGQGLSSQNNRFLMMMIIRILGGAPMMSVSFFMSSFICVFQVVHRAGLEKTVLGVVTAVMVHCVIL